MKNFYSQIKNFINIALFLGIFLQSYIANAQTTLAVGDIIFTGYDSTPPTVGGNDKYSFVLLTNISAGTVISFTDRGYTGSGWRPTSGSEGSVTWTSGSAIPMGTEILIVGLTASTYDPATTSLTANGTVTLTEGGTAGQGLILSNVGDQVIAYQGGSGSITGVGATVISGITYYECGANTSTATWDSTSDCVIGPNSSVIPPGLTGGTSAFYTGTISGTLAQSSKYNGAGAPFTTAAQIRAAVMNQANWTLSATTLTMPSGAPFLGIPPAITGNPPNRTICVGSNTTFSITATNATAYQWQVNAGSGFTNLTNVAPYSGATTATLTITGATASMTGFTYRCVASGAGSATSNAGTLIVPNIIVSTTLQNNVNCFGGTTGSATVSAIGGISPYTYSWAPSGGTAATATGLAAGTYTVTVTDNIGCQKTHNVIITQPTTALNGTTSTTAALCFGGASGTATVVASGGTPGYTYSWAPSGGTAATATGLAAGTYSVTITDANGCPKTITGIVVGQPASAVDGTSSSTPVSCFGGANGTATVVASGGVPGYTYSWSPSGGTLPTATGLAAGTYSCTITDANGCPKTITGIVVGQPAAALNGSISTTSVSCFGGANGTATVTPSGGTPGYTYLWSTGATTPTITGLIAGSTYSVTITDANACIKTINNITITQPAVLNGTASTTSVSCFGGANGTATITPTGGTPGYTYLWSTGGTTPTITGLTAGTYSVTITDANSCPKIVSNIIVGQPAAVLDGTTSTTAALCFGQASGTATVVASGGTPGYTYSWAPSGGTAATATGLAAGTYSVTITDANGCPKIITGIVVGQPAAALDGTVTTTAASCFGLSNGTATVTPTGGTPGYTYSWSPTGGAAATATGLAAGTYSVDITDANGCTKTVTGIVVGQPAAALDGTATTTAASCFGLSNGTATVTPSGGTAGYTYLWSSGALTPTATGLAAGTYSVEITDANGCTKTISNIVVNQPTVITPNPSQTDVSCNSGANGSATVTPTGGTGSYTYLWNTGATTPTINGLSAGTYGVTITDANSCPMTQSFTIAQPAALVASEGAKTNASCNGGSNGTATVAVAGGVAPYAYSWTSNSSTTATATGLAAGTYNVTVTDDNGCTTTQSFTITEPAAFAVTSTQTNVKCFGDSTGSATVNVTGGTGIYTYSWSPTGGAAATATGLTAGTYTVTITDGNGCSTTEAITITEPTSALTATPGTVTHVGCFGDSTGSATVNVTGGTGAYTYSWTPSGGTAATATGLAAGTYTVTVTDANLCQTTQNFTINQPVAPLSATTASTDVSCFSGSNGTATVTVSGGTAGYTYSWAPSGGITATATGLAAGTYTVTITDTKGCQLTKNVTIGSPTPFSATIAKTDVSCNGGANGSATVTVTGATAPYTYSWSPAGGTAPTASGLAAGTYNVTITDANGCSTTESVTIGQPAILAATTTHTDVTCIGRADGSATVTPTGGTSPYTYAWTPSGGTAATATGLAAGTYNVTVTDANGCSVTKSVSISTTPDTTAPVPNITNLPDITNFCSVLSSQITIPTATDFCAGTVTATTTSPLNYTAVGTYVITWNYNDGNGNTSSQNQTVKVVASPLNLVTFAPATYTYNGSAQTIQVANLPAGATVVYSTSPSTGTLNGAVNAGVYTVTAVISPAATAPNCAPITLTAQITINKAAQQITFITPGTRTLGGSNTFSLGATASSGLAVTYAFTYKTALPPATVAPTTGVVNMLRPGEVTIVASQAGNNNYLPAADVTQLLVIKNNDITVSQITVGTKVYPNPAKALNYVMACGENNVNVTLTNTTNATFTPSANFTINTPKPGIYTQNVTITSEDGSASDTYVITVEKPFAFYDIVHQKFNNVLIVNNNPQTNGGYEFVSYQWFKNGQVIGTGQYISAGDALSNVLDLNADYYVKMTTKDGKVLQTCSTKIKMQKTAQIKLYPNPVQTGKMLTVDADLPQSDLDNMQISLYSVSGKLITTVKSSTAQTQVQLPPTTESNMYLVVIESGSIKQSFKVIVK